MKILITGGAGFIGSHLAEALLGAGHSVAVIDNLSTGSMENIEAIRDRKGFSFYVDSIMNTSLMERLIGEADSVFHLAAAVGVKYIIDNPLESIKTNVAGTEIVLDCANRQGHKKVIIASTSEVYGKNMDGLKAFRESDDRVLGTTTIPRWSYSCTKALDEFLALAYYKEKKLPVVIVRLFNTCGPRQTGRYGMVLPRFIRQALTGRPITVYGDGTQTRCFTYVDDVIDALLALMGTDKAVGEIFNLGNPDSISIKDLAGKVKETTGSASRIINIPYEQAYEVGFEDMKHRQPDISKIKDLIGFDPKVPIDEIITRTVEYFREN